jgi:hypothetical protein
VSGAGSNVEDVDETIVAEDRLEASLDVRGMSSAVG